MDEIVTNKIRLINSKGDTKITLSADHGDGYASIELIGCKERFLIQLAPDGRVYLSIDTPPVIGVVQLSSHGFMAPKIFDYSLSESGVNADCTPERDINSDHEQGGQ